MDLARQVGANRAAPRDLVLDLERVELFADQLHHAVGHAGGAWRFQQFAQAIAQVFSVDIKFLHVVFPGRWRFAGTACR